MKRRHPLGQLVLARLREFYRQPAVIFWVYGFPLLLALGLGIAFAGGEPSAPEFGGREVAAVAVQNEPDPAEAAALLARLQSEGVAARAGTPAECQRRLHTGKAALVIVPSAGGYQYLYDAARPGSLLARFRVDDVVQRWKGGGPAWPTTDRRVSEPGSRYIDFLIPGLMGLNLMGGGLWGVGFVVVDMRVRRLLKRLLGTPMRPRHFLMSVLLGRVVFIVPEMLVLILVGHLAFGVPVRGDPLTLALVILVGGAAFADLGLLLASRTENTEVVSGLINLCMLPMWMLSGTFFSPHRFPEWLQPFIRALPLTQLNDALRAVMLDGEPLDAVLKSVLVLAAWAVVSFVLAVKWFRWH